jgi:MOSC domain-containing protein YiiM
MRVLSVNVGTPHEIGTSRGRPVFSGILKRPVKGPIIVRTMNLEGDRQADPAVHGGEEKAVYAYPSEHYTYWKERFPKLELPWGSFGENLTTEGILEDAVRAGDRLSVGSAELAVTQPRFPCFKLGMRFETQRMVRSFLASERSGFYLKVLREGRVEAGDEVVLAPGGAGAETIADTVRAVKRKKA